MTERRLTRGSVLGLVVALSLLLVGFGLTAHAFDTPGQTRAARLTFVQGTVTVNEPANAASVPGQLNLPLLAGVQVITGGDGQAEIEFEDGSVARLTPNSVLSLDNLSIEPGDVFSTNLNLLRGLAYFELRATQQYLYTIYAGGDLLTPVENTTVRVNFDAPPPSISVLDGTAHVERVSGPNNDSSSAGYQTDVRAGESLQDDANYSNRYFLTQTIAEDSWDQWNEDMDQTAAAQAADTTGVRNDYAGAEGYGWSDLDANGTWYNVPGQGQVWQPYVAQDDSGFDPYGYGAWVNYPATGYIWASAYSWGWTPYRCGSWSYFNSFGWGWAPGAGCGGYGWGFVGGGRPVNIGSVPVGYRPIRVPVVNRGPEHPLLTVRTSVVAEPTGRPVAREARQIAGVTAAPIKPTGSGAVPGGAAAGSSLRRDYPVDSATHAPVLGLASTQPTVVRTTRNQNSNGSRTMTAAPADTEQPAVTTYPSSRGPIHPVPVERNQPYVQPAPVNRPYNQPERPAPATETAPVQRYQPAPRTEPQPAPRSTSSPAPSPARTTYSPPPAPSHPSPPPAPSSSTPSGHGPK
jgi:hypothetical protein